MSSESELACNIGAFTPEQRDRYNELRREIESQTRGFSQLPDGYALAYGADPLLYLKLAEWVTLERLCCPFLTFALVLDSGSVRLELTGGPGVREFLAIELGLN